VRVDPVRWKQGRLEILDQRLLPYREKYLVCRSVDQVVDAIKTLAVRGAPLLGVTGAYAMALAKDPRAAAKKLNESRPTAVNLRWAVEGPSAPPTRSPRRSSSTPRTPRCATRSAATGHRCSGASAS
jgi:methylthioribose-1-phosphate isomerase